MEFTFTPEQQAWRNELRTFFKENVPEDYDPEGAGNSQEAFDEMMRINKRLGDRGWLTIAWPKEYGGGGAGPIEQLIFHEEYGYCRGPNLGPGARFVGPAIIAHGSPELRAKHLPPIAAGDNWWCQGFSEPETGSDLASLQTRAVVDGDDFVVNGSKIWTSWAHLSNYCWLAVRTNPDAPKHRGISILIMDMQTPGLTIRPVINMAGHHHFNQVYFDNVRIPRSNMVGAQDRGWYVMTTTLGHERATRVSTAAEARRTLEELLQFAKETIGPSGQPIASDPIIAAKLSQMAIDINIARLFAYRVASAQANGKEPDQEASILKLWCSELLQRLSSLGMYLIGPQAVIHEGSKWTKLRGRFLDRHLNDYSATLASGTSEVQRNIIANRGLGMPRS